MESAQKESLHIPDCIESDYAGHQAYLDQHSYLAGPKSRRSEFRFALGILIEFIKGFRKLHFVGPCITFFGSARFGEEHKYYHLARETARTISQMGFTILTGGGPGIMEAANRGAYESGGYSVGCGIKLPHEQKTNPYMDEWVTLNHFFVRKVMLLKYSYAFIVLPGGWGTMDELFETLTLVQTGTISHFPVVLMGVDYYQPLIEYMDTMAQEGTISKEDLHYILATDDITEAQCHIRLHMKDHYKVKRSTRSWLLGERKSKILRKRSSQQSEVQKK